MKKAVLSFIFLTFVFSALYGEYTRDASRAVTKARILKTMVQPETSVKTADTPRTHETLRPLPPVKRDSRVSHLMLSHQKATKLNASKGTLVMQFGGQDTLHYNVGDMIDFTILTSGKVELEFYVDNGDSIFDPGTDFLMGDPGNPVIAADNMDPDMNPDPGIFEISFPSNMMMDGPFFGIENCIIYVVGTDLTTGDTGMAVAMSSPSTSNYAMYGRVSTSDGQGAQVLVLGFTSSYTDTMGMGGPDGMNQIAYAAFTDADGYYTFHVDTTYAYDYFQVSVIDVLENYPGLFADPSYQEVQPSDDPPSTNFTLMPGLSSVSGTLTDENNNPISGVTMHLDGNMTSLSATTDGSGYYTFQITTGYWYLNVNENDLLPNYLVPYGTEIDLWEDADTTVNMVTMACDGQISGNVSDMIGTGLPGYEVHGESWAESGSLWSQAFTDEMGNYMLPVASALDTHQVCDDYGCWMEGGYWVDVWGNGPQMIQRLKEPPYNSGDNDVNFVVVETDVHIYGVVTDANTGQPLPNVYIHAFTPQDSMIYTKGMGGYFDNGANTDEFGHYDLNLVSGMHYQLEVFFPDMYMFPAYTEDLGILAGGEFEKNLAIKKPVTKGSVSGHVWDKDSNPLSGLQTELEGYAWDGTYIYKMGNTKTDGSYEFRDVPFGGYNLTVYPNDGSSAPASKWVNVDQYSTNPVLDFFFGKDDRNMIHGIVMDDMGNPIPGALVQAYNWSYDQGYISFTSDTGYYELYLDPGDYELTAGSNGYYKADEYYTVDGSLTIDLTLMPLENPDSLVTITGMVRDDSNQGGVDGAFIMFETWDYLAYTNSHDGGNYSLNILRDSYDIYCEAPGFYGYWNYDYFTENRIYDIALWPENYNFGFSIQAVYDKDAEHGGADHGGAVWVDWAPMTNSNCGIQNYLVSWKTPSDPFWRTGETVMPDAFSEDQQMYHYEANVGTNDLLRFQVVAVGWCGGIYYSGEVEGQAIDNLPPSVPGKAKGSSGADGILLSWSGDNVEPVKYYTINRKASDGTFEFLANTTETEYLDNTQGLTGIQDYQIIASDFSENHSDPALVSVNTVTGLDNSTIPTEYALKQNFPNPFNPTTTIGFSLPEASSVNLVIYNALGNVVTTLVHDNLDAGNYSYIWNGRDAASRQVSSGVYFYKLTAGQKIMMNKMVLMR